MGEGGAFHAFYYSCYMKIHLNLFHFTFRFSGNGNLKYGWTILCVRCGERGISLIAII